MKIKWGEKINWKYALGELFLIFLGISLAIGFNNWNDARKQSQVETQILKEILGELNDDIKDIKINKSGHEAAIRANEVLLDYYLGKTDSISKDSLNFYVFVVYKNFTSISNTASYEYLKSIGIGVVENDSLRKKLSKLYDVTYENITKIEEQHQPTQFYKYQRELFWEHMKDHLAFDEQRLLKLKERKANQEIDPYFVQSMFEMKVMRQYIVKYYVELIEQITDLKQEIIEYKNFST
jgi:hypothetical protein